MRLSVGTNFDPELPGRLAELEGKPVDTLYGKLSADLVGGGRPTLALPTTDWTNLEDQITAAHKHGIRFNYLLNASCMDNRETTAGFTAQFKEFLGRLREIHVDAVTVTAPLLIRRVRLHWPDVPISLSTFADVHSLQQVREYASMGVNEITLPESKNRDFEFLRALRKHPMDCTFRLIATNDCMLNCPFRAQHANFQSHASQSGHMLKGFALDYYMIKCTQMKQAEPERLLQAPWIRPEDLEIYEELGFDRFKLTERMKRTDAIVRTARAYASRHYDGNLLEILNTRLSEDDFEMPNFSVNMREEYAPPKKMADLFRNMFSLQARVENKKLNGFLKGFMAKKCDLSDCRDCGYCGKWAKEAVTYTNLAFTDGASLERTIGELESGAFFGREQYAWRPDQEAFLCKLTAEIGGLEERESMRKTIRREALQLARRQMREVSSRDIALMYLTLAPEPYQPIVRNILRQEGFDPDAFGEV